MKELSSADVQSCSHGTLSRQDVYLRQWYKIKYFYRTSTEHSESRDFECPSSRGIPEEYNGQREIRCV